MGSKNSHLDFDSDDNLAWLSDFDDNDFEDFPEEKPNRHRSRRKLRAKRSGRNRFSDYEGERWLKRQVADWDDYDSFDDDDDLAVSFSRSETED
jgi:hypothetical protein